jgi:hypothetical protein
MNPNTMTFKTVFQAEYQMSHYKEPVYGVLADSRLESSLTKGQTIERSFASDVVVNDMGGDGSYDPQAVQDTAETLTISYEKEASIYIKSLDELQAHLPVRKKYGQKLGNALVNQIDGDVLLKAYQGAGSTLDDGDFAGTPGNGLALTTGNVSTLFVSAMTKMRLKNVVYNKRFRPSAGMKMEVPEGMPMAVISPEVIQAIELYLGGKDTLLGDSVTRNGYNGYFQGFETFCSNALAWTGTLALPTNPTDGDTLTINTVVLTFRAAPSVAGDLDIKATAALTLAEIVPTINAPKVARAGSYVPVSDANAALLKNITATDGTTEMTLVSSGNGTVEVDETFTAGGNVFVAGSEQLKCIFALSKSISLVIQKYPSLEENGVSRKIGKDFIAWTAYGIHVFTDQAPMIVVAAIDATSFSAASTVVN